MNRTAEKVLSIISAVFDGDRSYYKLCNTGILEYNQVEILRSRKVSERRYYCLIQR